MPLQRLTVRYSLQ